VLELILLGIVIGSTAFEKQIQSYLHPKILTPNDIPTKRISVIPTEKLASEWEEVLRRRDPLTYNRTFKPGDTLSPYKAVLKLKD
jgi:hypothetical protein